MKKYSIEELTLVVETSYSITEVLRKLNRNVTGNSHKLLKNKLDKYNIDYSHFKKHKIDNSQSSFKDCLVYDANLKVRIKSSRLKKNLIKIGREYICESCSNNGIWLNQNLSLEIDHIDGNWRNNTRENLRFLCPNCHSIKHSKILYKCNDCGSKCTKNSTYCIKCSSKYKKYNTKIDISKEELEKLVWEMPTTHIAKIYNVSDTLIKKKCDFFGISKPPRGYWSKNK